MTIILKIEVGAPSLLIFVFILHPLKSKHFFRRFAFHALTCFQGSGCIYFRCNSFSSEKRNISVNRNTGETVLHKASRMGYDVSIVLHD